MAKIGRNEPCPCGSGKKYKKCCIDRPLVYLDDGSVGIMDERTEQAKLNLERGYQLFYEGNEEDALPFWDSLWNEFIRDELQDTPMEELDSKIASSEIIANWFYEYPIVLENAAGNDPAVAKQLWDFCDTVVADGIGFPPDLEQRLELMRAVALSRMGSRSEADEEFRKLSESYPDFGSIYVEWALHLKSASKEKAMEVLRQGLEKCSELEDQKMLTEHLEHLRAEDDD